MFGITISTVHNLLYTIPAPFDRPYSLLLVLVSVSVEKDTSQKFVFLDLSEINRHKILKCFRKEKFDFRQAVVLSEYLAIKRISFT